MVQVQLRIPKEMAKELDRWVKKDKFKSRSDAIRTIIALYEERKKTRDFYKMLLDRSRDAREKPEELISLEEI